MRKAVLGASIALILGGSFFIAGASARTRPAPVAVDTTAHWTWTQSFDWTIDKTVAESNLEIVGGEPAVAEYTVTVTKSAPIDSHVLAGEACLTNRMGRATGDLSLNIEIGYRIDGGDATIVADVDVDTAAMPTLGAGESWCYPYVADVVLVDGADYRINTAVSETRPNGRTVSLGVELMPLTPSSAPDVLIDDAITVDDPPDAFAFAESGSATYTRSYDTPGTYVNVATIVETGQTADATVDVTEAPGCETTWDAVAYWCFYDQASPTADGADGHDADVVGPAFETSNIPPVTGNVAALSFDGIDDYAIVTDTDGAENLDGFDAITLAAWVNPDGPQLANGCCGGVVTKYESAPRVSWGLDIQDDEVRFVYLGDEFSSDGVDLESGEWTHIAATWDGSDVRLYVNGLLVAFGDDIVTSMDDNDAEVNIGAFEAFASGNRAARFDGLIDEVYVFDRALSAEEIADVAGIVVEPPGPSCSTEWDAVAYWCFDDQTSPTSDGADGHDADVVGPAFETSNIPPVASNVAALSLDGVDDHAISTDPDGAENLDGFDAITLVAWVNPDVVSGGPYEIVSKYASGGPFAPDGSGSGVAWGIDIKGGVVRFVYNWEEYEPATTVVNTGEWTHVAGSWDGNDVRLYINGELISTGNGIFTEIPDTQTPVNIGAGESNVSGNRFAFFDGLIDEVYVFDRVLTEAEIATLAGVDATEDWHIDLVLNWTGEGGNTSHSLSWTPGLGFDSIPVDETCVVASTPFSPAPAAFPYESLSVTHDPGVSVRIDIEGELTPVQGWLHTADDTCATPDGQGGGAELWFEFDIP